jgi:hypothetical protein
MDRRMLRPRTLPLLLIAALAASSDLASTPQDPAGGRAMPHMVSFLSGDVVAEPQVLTGTVSSGKADLSGPFRATYNFDKWIANTNQGDPSVYEILKRAQAAAGGVLAGRAQFKVDANAVVNSFITVVVDVSGESYTIKMYTCVDHRKTTVTETDTDILVTQVEGTACAYKAPQCGWSNEGEDVVYRIRK